MGKNSTRQKMSPILLRLQQRFEPVLRIWHACAQETVLALVLAIIISATLKQTTLAAHLCCGSNLNARLRRMQRYIANFVFKPADFWPLWSQWVCLRYLVKNESARIAFDWTKEGRGSILCAMLVLGGRGIPLMTRSMGYEPADAVASRIEDEMALAVRKAVPPSIHIIWLMDRGFGNCRMVSTVQSRSNCDYVIRIRGNIYAESPTQRELLRNWAPRARKLQFHRAVTFGKSNLHGQSGHHSPTVQEGKAAACAMDSGYQPHKCHPNP